MRAVVQRVSRARVVVDGEVVGEIGGGMLVLLGVDRGDRVEDAERLAGKLAGYRMFGDAAGRMNRALAEVGGAVLVVSQFTLCADVSKGRRPSFDRAEEPERATAVCEGFVGSLREAGVRVETGRFGKRMEVELVNDGPVTFVFEAGERER